MTTPAAPFNLDVYMARYPEASENRLQRLLFIAGQEDPQLAQKALVLAEKQMKTTQNVCRYKQVFLNSPSIQYDAAWVEQTQGAINLSLETLSSRLSAAQTHLHKEAIRSAYLALGEYYAEHGDLQAAMIPILRSKDYCINRNQTAHVCLTIIELALDMQNYSQVQEFVSKAEHSAVPGDTTGFSLKLKVASGIAWLAQGNFTKAATQLTSVQSDDDSVWASLPAAPEDIIIYGILTGMATLGRNQLMRLLDAQSALLDLTPLLRDALQLYCRADYPASLTILQQNLHGIYKLDMILAPHLDLLYQEIQKKCLVEYLLPYNKVGLNQMATTFHMQVDDLVGVLAELIGSKRIENARIDVRSLTLCRLSKPEALVKRRNEMQTRLQRMEDAVLNDAYAMMIRVACLENDGGGRKQGGFVADYMSDDDRDEPMPLVHGNPEDVY